MHVEHTEEDVSVYFKDGSSAKGDILIGADGVNSIGRSLILMLSLCLVTQLPK